MREIFTLARRHNGKWEVLHGPETAPSVHRSTFKGKKIARSSSEYDRVYTCRPSRRCKLERSAATTQAVATKPVEQPKPVVAVKPSKKKAAKLSIKEKIRAHAEKIAAGN